MQTCPRQGGRHGCGFGSAETLRLTFLRRLAVPPDHYRRHFATNA